MKVIGIGLLLLLAGCASLESPNPVSPYYAYPPGWVLQLNRTLTIPPNSATVRLQYGGIVPRNGVQEQDPYCVVELNTVSDKPQTLEPGRFEVRRVTHRVDFLAAAPSPFIKASFGMDGSGALPQYYKTEFHLRSALQPNIRSMTCAWNQMAPGNQLLMRPLTLGEIRGALGDWITLIPPGERV
jgi:hypothetical protein